MLRTPGYNTSALWPCNFRNGQPNLVLIGHSILAIIFPYIVLCNGLLYNCKEPHTFHHFFMLWCNCGKGLLETISSDRLNIHFIFQTSWLKWAHEIVLWKACVCSNAGQLCNISRRAYFTSTMVSPQWYQIWLDIKRTCLSSLKCGCKSMCGKEALLNKLRRWHWWKFFSSWRSSWLV